MGLPLNRAATEGRPYHLCQVLISNSSKQEISMKLTGKAKMVRIYIGEDDEWEGLPLYEAIVNRCKELNIAGATVYRGALGYGAGSHGLRKEKIFSLSSDLPIMITIVDVEEKINRILPVLDEMIQDGLIVLSDVEVIKYTARAQSRTTSESWKPVDPGENKTNSRVP